MGERQRAAIEKALTDGRVVHDGEPTRICTLEVQPAAGGTAPAWVQVLAGSLNFFYPFADDPAARLGASGAFGTLKPSLIEWQANEYATWDISGVSVRDVAFVIDQVLTRVLGCDDASYSVASSIEDI
ncbi:MAG TPA: hypothetical protein VJ890_06070 [Vineibacter sp.]|nr:hypothetical protein [Vineibacter sp.]